MNKAIGLVGITMLAVLGSGCSAADEQKPAAGQSDPQILRDVISGAFTLPGKDALRAMRVNNFLLGVGIKECGGTPPPLDATSDRYSQDLFPDLDLIRDRGFSEGQDDARHAAIASIKDPSKCSEIGPDSIKAFDGWSKLAAEWSDVVMAAKADSDELASQKAPMAQCLSDRTGLHSTASDPASFLQAVNVSLSKDGDREDELRYAAAYADCGRKYFEVEAEALAKPRVKLIDKNRQVLQEMASELSRAGYVP